MPTLSLKPTHKLVEVYDAAFDRFACLGTPYGGAGAGGERSQSDSRLLGIHRNSVLEGIRGYKRLQFVDQARQVFLHRFPDDIEIDAEIGVDKPVSHCDHAGPGVPGSSIRVGVDICDAASPTIRYP